MTEHLTINIPAKDFAALDRAITDLPYYVEDAQVLFEFLATSLSMGSISNDGPELMAILRLASRSLLDVAEKEAAGVRRMELLLRSAKRGN